MGATGSLPRFSITIVLFGQTGLHQSGRVVIGG